MANWKKVIVSGSAAELASLSLDTALPVGSGGTGASTLTDGGVLVGSGTGAVTALGQATDGQLVVGSTGADPVLATLTGGANITVTNTAGGISIAATGLGSGTVQSVSAAGTENGLTLTSDGDSVNPVITLGGALANVANTQLVNDSIQIGTTDITLGATGSSIAGLTLTGVVASGSFSGSFQGDGSNLTGIATSLGTSGNTGTGNIDLLTQALAVTGTGAISSAASAQGIAISAADASAANKGVASFASSNFTVTTGDVALSQDITIGRDLVVTRNLTVQGTASFNSEQNLDVADRFIRMASGSLANGDGGIAIQQTSATDAEAFGWDSNIARWGVTGSFDAAQNALVPDAFLSLVVDGGVSSDASTVVGKYTKKGNMFIGADENVWIYS